jgi:uncharacterized protein (TIGR03032 family)
VPRRPGLGHGRHGRRAARVHTRTGVRRRFAFVGLSQIRESSTFGDLPLTARLKERQSGVWMVDVRSGEVTGFLRFDDLVQEIFDVALLPGTRNPEIGEADGAAVARSFVLP